MMKNKITAPKKTTIKGQPHQLAYINDAEQGLLMALGGSGEMVNGVPAYFDGLGDDRSQGGFGGRGRDYDGGGGNERDDQGKDKAVEAAKAARDAAIDKAIADEIANRQAYEATMGGVTPGQATAMFGDATMAGKGFTSADIDRMLGSASVDVTGILPELQRRARRSSQFSTLGKILSPFRTITENVLGLPKGPTAYDNLATLISMPESTIMSGGLLGPDAVLGVPTGGIGAFGTPAHLSQGYFGQVTYTGMPNEDYTGPFANLVNPYKDPNADGPEVVPAQENPLTGEGVCPDGYIFDDQLQACRLDTGSTASDDTGFGTGQADGLMYRPTALDENPGFGTTGFDQMNSDFINTFAYNPEYYENQMDLTGFVPTPSRGLLV